MTFSDGYRLGELCELLNCAPSDLKNKIKTLKDYVFLNLWIDERNAKLNKMFGAK